MSKLVAMAIPVLQGKESEWHKFADELNGAHREGFKASRSKLGVRERVFYQTTPSGDMVVVTLEGDDPVEAFRNFASGSDEFTKWFVDQVNRLHGFDLKQASSTPLPELVIDSETELVKA